MLLHACLTYPLGGHTYCFFIAIKGTITHLAGVIPDSFPSHLASFKFFFRIYIDTNPSHLSLLLSWILNISERSPCSTLAPLQCTLCQTPKRFIDTYRSDWCPLCSGFSLLCFTPAPCPWYSVSASSPSPALVLYSPAPDTLALTVPSTFWGYAHLRASAQALSICMSTAAHDNHGCCLMPSSSTFSDLSI